MHRQLACALLIALVAAPSIGVRGAAPAGGTDDRQQALDRFLLNDAEPLSSYSAVRRLSASNKRYGLFGWMKVRTELAASGDWRYVIEDQGGSGYIRGRVLQKVLDAEARVRRGGSVDPIALTPNNYEFGEPGLDEQGLIKVPIRPRRREELLVNGAILLTPFDGDLVRIEGRPAKSPSFWTRRVEIVRRYGRVNGVRVPLELSSTAHIFLAGESALEMCYDYESVNGTPVEVRTSCS